MPTTRSNAPERRAANADGLDPLVAVAFLENEAGRLRDALTRPGETDRVQRALRCQERAHADWLELVGQAYRSDSAHVAEEIGALYGFHGRVGAILERGFDPLLSSVVEARLRLLLIVELQRRTSEAVSRIVASFAERLHSEL